jgi:hypothetical protein
MKYAYRKHIVLSIDKATLYFAGTISLAIAVIAAVLLYAASFNPLNASDVYNDTMPVHRFYNFKQGVHFYTANQTEATHVNNTMGHTYRYEGISYFTYRNNSTANTMPVHRFYNFKQGVHFYTANQTEATHVNNTMGHTYRYEGVAYYGKKSPKPGSSVHRFYNFKQGVHFYTANQTEATHVNNTMGHTYRYEGVAYYSFSNYYQYCSEARDAGVAPLYKGQPGYAVHLDRDQDGIACE